MANAFPGPIQNVVVVMLENRSYDNILGALYAGATPPKGQEHLDGLAQQIANDTVHNQTGATQLNDSGPQYPATCIPVCDPGEYFAFMAQQFLGLAKVPTTYPYGSYPPDEADAMAGFQTNYEQIGDVTASPFPNPAAVPTPNQGDVMNYFTPQQLPVTSFLAANFGVSDVWFASVPSQTYVNRAFTFCAAPAVYSDASNTYSFISDLQYAGSHWSSGPSILDQLDASLTSNDNLTPPYWKVYFHDHSIGIETVDTLSSVAAAKSNANISTYDGSDWPNGAIPTQLLASAKLPPTFVDDVTNNTLPPFAFIEPRYFNDKGGTNLAPNSNHPGVSNYLSLQNTSTGNPPIDAAMGELFLMQLYNLLQGSGYWESTLLVITYDEHGGVYDHVLPPAAPDAAPAVPNAQDNDDLSANGFDFSIFGGRVPAIFVSPYIKQSSTLRPVLLDVPIVGKVYGWYDHTSIMKTVRELFAIDPGPLSNRDAQASSFAKFIEPEQVNFTGQYSGALVVAPGTLVFSDSTPQTAFASAGSTVTVTASTSADWLTIATSGTTYLQISVTPNANLASGTYTGTINVTASSQTQSISVTAIIS